ncbi:MAG: DUF2726 domain-containing protein [Pseudomonadota bacterium]
MEFIGILILIGLAFAGGFGLSTLLRNRRPKQQQVEISYRRASHFLSPAEQNFYSVLVQAVGKEFSVLPKVRVADILTPTRAINKTAWQFSIGRIADKHFDFVLCESATMAAVAAITLVDSGTAKRGAAQRQAFFQEVCASADLPLYSFDIQAEVSIGSVRAELFGEAASPVVSAELPEESADASNSNPDASTNDPDQPHTSTANHA